MNQYRGVSLRPGRWIRILAIGLALLLASSTGVQGAAQARPIARDGGLVVSLPYGAALHLYPSSDAPDLVNLGCGTRLTVLGSTSGWYHVEVTDGPAGWVGAARVAVGAVRPSCSNVVTYQVGERVITQVASGCLSLRRTPSRQASYTHCVANGHVYTITTGPIAVAGEDWFGVWSLSTGAGWSLALYLLPGPDSGGVPSGARHLVVTEHFGAALHAYPASGAPAVYVLPCGTQMLEVAQANGWYQVATLGGPASRFGWVGGALIAVGNAAGCANTTTYQIGDGARTHVASGCLSLRDTPSPQAHFAYCVASGHVYLITSGPLVVAGETWLGVWSASTGTGWVLAQFLQRAV